MEIKLADEHIIMSYKSDFMKYIEDVLIENSINKTKEEIETIYDNICKFVKDGTAIIIVAIEDKELLGFIWSYKRIVNDEERLHINYFVINSNYRGNGIGQKLIKELYNKAREMKITVLELMVTFSNEKAINFYKKQGFFTERISLCKKI